MLLVLAGRSQQNCWGQPTTAGRPRASLFGKLARRWRLQPPARAPVGSHDSWAPVVATWIRIIASRPASSRWRSTQRCKLRLSGWPARRLLQSHDKLQLTPSWRRRRSRLSVAIWPLARAAIWQASWLSREPVSSGLVWSGPNLIAAQVHQPAGWFQFTCFCCRP